MEEKTVIPVTEPITIDDSSADILVGIPTEPRIRKPNEKLGGLVIGCIAMAFAAVVLVGALKFGATIYSFAGISAPAILVWINSLIRTLPIGLYLAAFSLPISLTASLVGIIVSVIETILLKKVKAPSVLGIVASLVALILVFLGIFALTSGFVAFGLGNGFDRLPEFVERMLISMTGIG